MRRPVCPKYVYDVVSSLSSLGPLYSIDWCKTPAPGAHARPRSAFRLAFGSFTEDSRNRLAVAGLQDERVLVEDDYDGAPHADAVTLAEAHHGYPPTAVRWQPASAAATGIAGGNAELLATSGDALRVWEFAESGPTGGGYVGMKAGGGGHRLTLKSTLSGVCIFSCYWKSS